MDTCGASGGGVNHDTPNELQLNEAIKLIVGAHIEFVWLTWVAGQERVSNTCQFR